MHRARWIDLVRQDSSVAIDMEIPVIATDEAIDFSRSIGFSCRETVTERSISCDADNSKLIFRGPDNLTTNVLGARRHKRARSSAYAGNETVFAGVRGRLTSFSPESADRG